ncbi:hypothetical protein AIOGIFDO_01882 [Candidatus Methanoperedenaceae archaeon GB37]|nr:hypothetical protein AIOGIFDO_01882 [Candidatus Methanoperedenaceae archaeon GB37]
MGDFETLLVQKIKRMTIGLFAGIVKMKDGKVFQSSHICMGVCLEVCQISDLRMDERCL